MSRVAIIVFCLFSCAITAKPLTELERQFDESLDPNDQREWMKRMSARPNHLGSEFGRENAEFIRDMYRSWGWKAELETFYVLFPTPVERVLEMTEPVSFKASLEEPTLAVDSTSGQKDEQLPTYNAYSIDGDVSGELVFVNYGLPQDYEELERRGIDVKGKIVLAKYLGSWRGIKPKVAAEKGAIGTIMYSDPADDGFARGDAYGDGGGWRSSGSVQRGSVMELPMQTGDPQTPFYGSTKDAKRLKLEEIDVFTRIPVLPISYEDAKPLLEALGGPLAPRKWRGGLEMPYHLGPGPAKVHLKLKFSWDRVPLHNVIAQIPGRETPDQWVIRGNHKDAWVNGARDPISGLVAMMAEGKAMGSLMKTGWRPKRTIIHASWDGEEQGLLGSTEWAEHHRDELQEKTVTYINTDSNGSGFLYIGGSHTLETLANEVMKDVNDPRQNVSVWKRSHSYRMINGTDEQKKEATNRANLRIFPLGSGSDYTPFLQHLGIASLNLGYGGEDEYGVYHSIYDSFDHFTNYIDPTFEYGVTLSKTAGRLTLRLSEADQPVFRFPDFVDNLAVYVNEVEKLADNLRSETEHINKLIDEGHFDRVVNPRHPVSPPKKKDPVPHFSFANVKNALAKMESTAKEVQTKIDSADFSSMADAKQNNIHRAIYQAERLLIREGGLPRRPWYRHYVYAPGFYTGYGVKTLPGIREALEERKWDEVVEQEQIAASIIEGYVDHLRSISALLEN